MVDEAVGQKDELISESITVKIHLDIVMRGSAGWKNYIKPITLSMYPNTKISNL